MYNYFNPLENQTIQPEAVIVVLPIGYQQPKERLGYEYFEYSIKGMVQQRIYAIQNAKTEYVLMLDDDVEFEDTFVEKLFNTMNFMQADCVIAPLTNDRQHNRPISNLLGKITQSQILVHSATPYYIRINRAAGYVCQKRRLTVPLYTQSGHGSHCFAKVSALRDICFEEEIWLEENGYALPEDQVMFYKLFLKGHKIAVSHDAIFHHLDAASTGREERKTKLIYARAHNYLIFWYKFIYLQEHSNWGKIKNIFAISYRFISEFFFIILPFSIIKHKWKYIYIYARGIKEGWHFCKERIELSEKVSNHPRKKQKLLSVINKNTLYLLSVINNIICKMYGKAI